MRKYLNLLRQSTSTKFFYNSFISQHRPLFALPPSLSLKNSTQSNTLSSIPAFSSSIRGLPVFEDASSSALAASEVVEEDSTVGELVEVVDFVDGKANGSSYLTRLSPETVESLIESESSAEEVDESLQVTLEEAAENELEEAEIELQALEASYEDGIDPYEAWLISEPTQAPFSPIISRYLASQSPFVPPPVPTAAVPLPVSVTATPSSFDPLVFAHSPQTLADLLFLRPTPPPVTTILAKFANPLTPADSQAAADRFLSAASLSHRWQAQVDYANASAEAMESARRSYVGEDVSTRGTAGRIKKRGDLRIWSAEEGWRFVDLSRSVAGKLGSPFLPAEHVDLDWVDQIGLNGNIVEDNFYSIAMDSTKRKRMKKITKHKFKKRRKAQKVLRKKLGK